MQAPLYQTLSETLFIIPHSPGLLPIFNPNIVYMAAHEDTVIWKHKELQHLFDTITNVNLELKKQLIAAVEKLYFAEKKNR